MPYRKLFDTQMLWGTIASALGIANIVESFPLIIQLLTIVSLLITIGWGLYNFFAKWQGWNPRKKNKK